MSRAGVLRQRVGRILILAGATVWLVWLIVWFTGGEPDVGRFVPFHLMGVIPGAILARWDWLRRFGRND